MTTEDDNSDEVQGDFKPTGTVALGVTFVATILVLWGSVYYILLVRGATT